LLATGALPAAYPETYASIGPRGPRHAMLVSWTGKVPRNLGRNSWNGTGHDADRT